MIKLFNHKHMKQTLLILLALICLNAKAATPDPAITMTTAMNVGETISFSLKADVANTVVQIDFGNGTLVNKTIGTSSTDISGTLVGSQTVKIYGTRINYLFCRSIKLTSLDVTKNTALTDLICYSNQLTSLNVTKNTALIGLMCTNNQLTSLDVTKNTTLTTLMCNNNKLTSLDVTKNTALTKLDCGRNQLTSLDVTNNTALTKLDCDANPLTSINVTKNTALTILLCYSNQLTSIDVTKNTALTTLSCDLNQFTSIDVTKNTALKQLNCSNNKLTSLDVTKNTALTHLDCSFNQFTFTSLPLCNLTTFIYAPQNAITIAASFALNTLIDLSSQLTANGNTTTYKWKTKSGIILTAGTDYTISGGITTFTTIPTEKVYCEMTNATFPDFTGTKVLKTKLTTISTPTAVEDAKADVVDIYTQNQTVYLSLPEDALVQVYDITGHLVKAQNCISGTNSFEVPQKGVFMVKVNMNNQSETRKIVVR